MILLALLAIGIVAIAAAAGIHILKKEYLPLLRELTRTRQDQEQTDFNDHLEKEDES